MFKKNRYNASYYIISSIWGAIKNRYLFFKFQFNLLGAKTLDSEYS